MNTIIAAFAPWAAALALFVLFMLAIAKTKEA